MTVDDGVIRIGPLISALAFGSSDDRDVLRSAASAVLPSLAEDVGEHAALTIEEGDDVVYLEQAMGSTSAVDSGDWTGERHAAHGTAFGLALMAYWDSARLREYLDAPLLAFTPATVTDPIRVRAQLDEVRSTQIAWTVDQFADDVSGCAAPVWGSEGDVVASIGCFAPTYRFPGDQGRNAVSERVREAAAELTAALGSLPGQRS